MVNNDAQVYLLIGQDHSSKDTLLSRIKGQYLSKKLEAFNLDILFARDINLKGLQERLLLLPAGNGKRVVIVKEAQHLKDDAKKFLSSYCRKPLASVILVLEMAGKPAKDEFVNSISKFCRVFRSKEPLPADTFGLWRQIIQKRPDNALKMLFQLLKNGESPERILGGLRYSCFKDMLKPQDIRQRLQLLIDCDIDIKTGRLRPDFALEKLVVGLCGFAKPFGKS